MSIEDAINHADLPNLKTRLEKAQKNGASDQELLNTTRRYTAGYTTLFVGISLISALLVPLAWIFIALARNHQEKKAGRPSALPLLFFTVPYFYTRQSVKLFKEAINSESTLTHQSTEPDKSDTSEEDDVEGSESTIKSKSIESDKVEELQFEISKDGKSIAHKTGKVIHSIDANDRFTAINILNDTVFAGTKKGLLYRIDLDVDLDGSAEVFKTKNGPINKIKVVNTQKIVTYQNNKEYHWNLSEMMEDSSSSEEEYSSEDMAASFARFQTSEMKNKGGTYKTQQRHSATILPNGDILACDLNDKKLELNIFGKHDRRNTPEAKLNLFGRENEGLKYALPCINEKNNFAIFYCTDKHLMACDFKGNLIQDINIDWLSDETRVFPIKFTRTKNNFYADVIVYNNNQFERLKIKNKDHEHTLLRSAFYKNNCLTYMPSSKNIYFQAKSMEGGNGIYTLNAKTKKLTKVLDLLRDDVVLGMGETSDGNHVAVLFDIAEIALFKVNDTEKLERVSQRQVQNLPKEDVLDMRFINDDKDLLIASKQQNAQELQNFVYEMEKTAQNQK